MTLQDRMFWLFALSFFLGFTLLAVYVGEAGIAATLAFMGGTVLEKFRGIRAPTSPRREK